MEATKTQLSNYTKMPLKYFCAPFWDWVYDIKNVYSITTRNTPGI